MKDSLLANSMYKNVVQENWKNDPENFCPLRKEKQMDYLFEYLKEPFQKKGQKVLDACCGYGRLLHFLNDFDAAHYYHGVDYVPELIDIACERFFLHKNISFECYDVLTLSNKYKKEFDITINYKTFSWLDYYNHMLEQLFLVTKSRIYITSLFYDGDIDFLAQIYVKAMINEKVYTNLNTYSLPKFEKFCYSLGAKQVNAIPMKLDFDLHRASNIDDLCTYTQLTTSGERLEITGNIVLNWKLVEIVL